MSKIDFGTAVVYIVFIFIIIVVFLLSVAKVVAEFQANATSASMYSKPTWPEISTETTTEETEVEETEVSTEEYLEEEYYEE